MINFTRAHPHLGVPQHRSKTMDAGATRSYQQLLTQKSFNLNAHITDGCLPPDKWQVVEADSPEEAIVKAINEESERLGHSFTPEMVYVQVGTCTHQNGAPIMTLGFSVFGK